MADDLLQGIGPDGIPFGKGRVPRDYEKHPYGSIPFVGPLDPALMVARAEWPQRIREMDRL